MASSSKVVLATDHKIMAFIPDDDLVWLEVEVVKEDKGIYEVEIIDGDYKVTPQTPSRKLVNIKSCGGLTALPLQNENLGDCGVDDMTTLNYLHEASILDNLRRRFKQHLPYTYTGEICIAVS